MSLPEDRKTAEMAPLLRIMLPYLPLICVAAILGAPSTACATTSRRRSRP
jgi:peptidoglycan biosynthesis protein MviN/MurJ (putative lipid II flippase)